VILSLKKINSPINKNKRFQISVTFQTMNINKVADKYM